MQFDVPIHAPSQSLFQYLGQCRHHMGCCAAAEEPVTSMSNVRSGGQSARSVLEVIAYDVFLFSASSYTAGPVTAHVAETEPLTRFSVRTGHVISNLLGTLGAIVLNHASIGPSAIISTSPCRQQQTGQSGQTGFHLCNQVVLSISRSRTRRNLKLTSYCPTLCS